MKSFLDRCEGQSIYILLNSLSFPHYFPMVLHPEIPLNPELWGQVSFVSGWPEALGKQGWRLARDHPLAKKNLTG